MKINITYIVLICIILKSCIPPLSKIYLENKTNENLILITKPSIESNLDLNGEKLDSLLVMKTNTEKDFGIYKIQPNAKIYFYLSYGGGAKKYKNIKYEEAKIIKYNDTISIDQNFIKNSIVKKSKYIYVVQVRK